MENKKKNTFVAMLFIALFFGIAGGVMGEIVTRVYLLQDAYKVPLFGEINVPENVYGGSNLIIESPKKVIVEQNTKVLETINSVDKNIVGIFDKLKNNKKREKASTTFKKIDDYYNLKFPRGEGYIITSDGWIMSNFVPEELLTIKKTKATTTLSKLKEKFVNQYVVITGAGKVYDLIDIKLDNTKSISFWRIKEKDLNVRPFESVSAVDKGQLVVATNFRKATWLTTISEKYEQEPSSVFSSDKTYSKIKLVQDLSSDFGNGFLFNTEGNLIAMLASQKDIIPVSSYFSCLSCLLSNKSVSRPYLGLYYVNLNNFSDPVSSKALGQGAMIYPNNKGVAIVKDSPAEIAGLKAGDIITAINAIKIDENNTLSSIIASFRPNEKINLTVKRGEKEMQVIVTLAALQ